MDNNLPQHTEQHGNVVARWDPAVLAGNFIVRSTFACVNPTERQYLLSVIEGDCVPGESMIGKEMWLSHYICHPIELTDPETGEVVDAIRTILPQEGGPPVAFVSAGILKSIGRIEWAQQRPGPWDPPIRVLLKQRSTGKGRRTYSLIPITG